ncbi:MAG: zinc ribbon domain-containing protein [Planctomycetota bacterium]
MQDAVRWIMCVMVVFLAASVALADGTCAKCREKVESERWNFCPYCGMKLGQTEGGPPAAGLPSPREGYEPVSWDKVRFEKKKYHNRKVKLTVRYTGIGHFFAPAEAMGVTDANFINFSFMGNRTNYVDTKKTQLVEKLKGLRPYATLIIYGLIKVQEDVYGRGDDVYVVLVDDLDVE